MSASGYQQLPRYLIQLILNTRGMACPPAAAGILKSLEKAMHAPTPRTTLNRSLTRLHRYQPQAVQQVIDWLSSSCVLETMQKKGGGWALPLCRDAFIRIGDGVTPHVAFGMNRPGQRKGMGFTVTQDAGLLARYLMEAGSGKAKAIELGQAFREQCLPPDSEVVPEIRQLRARVSEHVGGLDLALVDHIESKYQKKLHTGD